MKTVHVEKNVFVHGIELPYDSVMLVLSTGMIFVYPKLKSCPCKAKQEMLVWLPDSKKGVKCHRHDEFSRYAWNFYHHKVNKFKKAYEGNYASMMKHSRKKKPGSGGGVRENKMAITDYECVKNGNQLHDFMQSFY